MRRQPLRRMPLMVQLTMAVSGLKLVREIAEGYRVSVMGAGGHSPSLNAAAALFALESDR